MNCLRCGRKIPEGKAFCRECSETVSTQPEEPRNTHVVLPTRTPEPAKKPVEAPKETNAPTKTIFQSMPLVTLLPSGLCLVLALALMLVCSHFYGASYRQEQAELAQKANALTQTNRLLEQTKDELAFAVQEQDSLREQLNSRAREIRSLNDQLNQYQQQSADAQKDLKTAETENSELTEKLQACEARLTEQDGLLSTMQTQLDTLTTENKAMKTTLTFINAHVVFVENDGSGYYHTYSCASFKRQSFWAYNLSQALSLGLQPCPACH